MSAHNSQDLQELALLKEVLKDDNSDRNAE